MQYAFDPDNALARQVPVQDQVAAMHRHPQARGQVLASLIQLRRRRRSATFFFQFSNEGGGSDRIVSSDVSGNLVEVGCGAWRYQQATRRVHAAGG